MPNPLTKNKAIESMKKGSKMAATKTVARRKPTSAKKTAAKKTTAAKRKSAAKKPVGRKPTAKATARSKRVAARESGKVDRLEKEAAEASQLQGLLKDGLSIREAATEAGISVPRARRLVAKASVKPRDRIVGTDEEIGARIVDLVDNDGMKLVPDIVARTGMSAGKVRRLYRDNGGAGLKAGRPSAKGNGAPKRKSATSKAKSATKSTAKAKSAAPRERKSRAKKMTPAERREARKARSAERRAARREQTSKMTDELHDLDTEFDRVKEIMEDRIVTIQYDVNGRPMKPRELKVSKVIKVEDGKGTEGGKVVFFVDVDQRHHTVNFRNITDVRAG